jgi:hypothetical protein
MPLSGVQKDEGALQGYVFPDPDAVPAHNSDAGALHFTNARERLNGFKSATHGAKLPLSSD